MQSLWEKTIFNTNKPASLWDRDIMRSLASTLSWFTSNLCSCLVCRIKPLKTSQKQWQKTEQIKMFSECTLKHQEQKMMKHWFHEASMVNLSTMSNEQSSNLELFRSRKQAYLLTAEQKFQPPSTLSTEAASCDNNYHQQNMKLQSKFHFSSTNWQSLIWKNNRLWVCSQVPASIPLKSFLYTYRS